MTQNTVPANISTVSFSALKLRARTRLLLTSLEGKPECEVEFAAALHGKSIFVALPDGKTGSHNLQVGNRYTVSGFNGTGEFSFTSHILLVQEKPFFHAHLAYPDSVVLTVVRDDQRVNVSIPVQVVGQGARGAISGTMRDLSVSGALVESAVPIGAVGDSLSLAISTRFEGREVNLNLPAVIRHGRDEGGVFKFGLEFGEIAQSDKLILYYLLFTQAKV